jgi:hypothetical protein
MTKYYLAALALKGFSSCQPARSLYRGIGNRIGARSRAHKSAPGYYFERVERNLAFCKKYCELRPDDYLLELGTGWMHWEAMTLRLFYDFKAVLYDVWDNRQLSALKSFLTQLEARMGSNGFLAGQDLDRARRLIAQILTAESFDEIYDMFGFEYVVDPDGLMKDLPRNHFRIAISAGVMEHIPAVTAPEFVTNMGAVLAPGGFGINSINIGDHLYIYDSSANPKQYLTYSDSQWKFWFENGVQYINRIQRSDWLRMFDGAGFALREEGGAYSDLSKLPVHPQFGGLSRKDTDCTNLILVAQKASPAAN